MPSMPLRVLPAAGPRHHFDRDPTPEYPTVRVYPEIPWRRPPSPAAWVRDDGEDRMDQNVIAEFSRGVSHYCEELPISTGNDAVDVCNVCKRRPSTGFDDFFGYTCNLCNITHRLRYKQRGVNPWTGGKTAG